MDRTEAFGLLKDHLHPPNLIKHSLAAEACMRKLALRLGGDPDLWGLAGLLHDLDYETTEATPERHALVSAEILAGTSVPAPAVHAILAHNGHAGLDEPLDIALWVVDPTTGFLTACALMHPARKLAPLELPFLLKRFKEKSFARGANRDQIAACVRLELELPDFLTLNLAAMTDIAADLGL